MKTPITESLNLGFFGGGTCLSLNQVAGILQQTGNVNISRLFPALGIRVRENYHGRYITSFGGTNPARNQYRFARTVTDLSFSYRLSSNTQLFCDVNNLTNEPQKFYLYVPSQMMRTTLNGTGVTFGMSGRF